MSCICACGFLLSSWGLGEDGFFHGFIFFVSFHTALFSFLLSGAPSFLLPGLSPGPTASLSCRADLLAWMLAEPWEPGRCPLQGPGPPHLKHTGFKGRQKPMCLGSGSLVFRAPWGSCPRRGKLCLSIAVG